MYMVWPYGVWMSFLLCYTLFAYAQQPEANIAESAESKADTLLVIGTDTINTAPVKKLYEPNTALKWALLPGGGQAYNKQYWKASLYAASVLGFGITAIQQRRAYNSDYAAYSNLLHQHAQGIAYDSDELASLRVRKKIALRNANWLSTAALLSYSFSLVDAYASAHIHNDIRTHSPLQAAYRSAVLPGFGQAYNRKYWKIPIVYAGLAAGSYAIYYTWNECQTFREEYLARTRLGYGTVNEDLTFFSDSELLIQKNQYRRYLELSILLTSVWYVTNIVDALIDAHLHDFDVSPDLSWQVSPYVLPPHVTTNLADTQTTFSGGLRLVVDF